MPFFWIDETGKEIGDNQGHGIEEHWKEIISKGKPQILYVNFTAVSAIDVGADSEQS